jgi:hypothetical protein
VNVDETTLDDIRATQGQPRSAETPCAWPGCTRTPADGHVLVRVNDKGQPGIWMCRADAAIYAQEVSR